MGIRSSSTCLTSPAARTARGVESDPRELPVASHLFLRPPLLGGGAPARIQAFLAGAEGPGSAESIKCILHPCSSRWLWGCVAIRIWWPIPWSAQRPDSHPALQLAVASLVQRFSARRSCAFRRGGLSLLHFPPPAGCTVRLVRPACYLCCS